MTELHDNKTLHRFEWYEAGGVSFIAYHREGDLLVLETTQVPSALAGRGIGTRLATAVLDQALHQGDRLAIRCAFIRHLAEQTPGYRELIVS